MFVNVYVSFFSSLALFISRFVSWEAQSEPLLPLFAFLQEKLLLLVLNTSKIQTDFLPWPQGSHRSCPEGAPVPLGERGTRRGRERQKPTDVNVCLGDRVLSERSGRVSSCRFLSVQQGALQLLDAPKGFCSSLLGSANRLLRPCFFPRILTLLLSGNELCGTLC